MKILLLFESLKLFKRNRLWLLFPALMLIIGTVVTINHWNNEKQIVDSVERQETKVLSMIDTLTSNENNFNEMEKERFALQIEEEKKKLEILQSDDDVKKTELKLLEWQNPDVISMDQTIGAEYPKMISSIVKELTVQEYQLLLDRQIKPMYPLIAHIPETLIDFYTEQDWESYYYLNYKRKYDQGWLAFYQFFQQNGSFLIYGLVVLIFGSSMTLEKTNKQNHQGFLTQLNVTPTKLLFTKIVVSFFWLSIILLVSATTVLVTAYLFSDMGSLNYPILTYYFPSEYAPLAYSWTTLGEYLIKAVMLLLMSCLLIISFCFVIGKWVRSELVVWVIGFSFIGLAYLSPAEMWNPLYYLHTHAITSGLGSYYSNQNVSSKLGILLQVISMGGMFLFYYLTERSKKNGIKEKSFLTRTYRSSSRL